MKKVLYVLVVVAATSFSNSNAFGGSMFSDDFTGGASATYWANPSAADYVDDAAVFSGTNGNYLDREYLHTVDTDYAAQDFVATVDLTNANSGDGSAFFGLGEGTPSLVTEHYYEPKTGPYAYVRYHGQDFFGLGGIMYSDGATEIGIAGDNQPSGTTLRIQLSWDAATSTGTYSVDFGCDGTYEGSQSFTNVDLSTQGATTRLFVGGALGVKVDNFSVVSVPEPSSPALLVAGLLGLVGLVWRRRK